MAPRTMPLPSAQTESARELRRTFFCELCQKGYARINEFEAHEGSYDHQHRKRLKEMKAMTRNPTAAVKASRAEKRRNENSEMISIKLRPDTSASSKPSNRPDRPIGWPSDSVETSATPDAAATKQAEAAAHAENDGAEEETERWEQRPIEWDDLGQLEELLDVRTNRSMGLGKVVGGHAEYLSKRLEPDVQADIWARVRGIRSAWVA